MGRFKNAIKETCSSIQSKLRITKPAANSGAARKDTGNVSVSKPLPVEPSVAKAFQFLDQDIIHALKHRLSRDQELEVEKLSVIADLEELEKARGQLRDAMWQVENDLEKAKISKGLTDRTVSKLERRLAPLRKRQQRLNEIHEELEEEEESLNEEQHKQRTRVCTIMESLLTDAGMIADFEPSAPVARQETIELLREIEIECQEVEPDGKDDALEVDNAPRETEVFDAATVVHESPSLDEQKQQDLNRSYVVMRGFLRQAQAELEDRHEIFGQERAAFREEQKGKDEPESITALDLEQIERTRELTQEVAQAEGNFRQAKQAAFLAGVDLGASDLESGFVDRDDDGYRMSDEDGEGGLDRAQVLRWLNDVESQEDEKKPADGVETDEWDRQSVGMCDSASMVAEGPARRRIDQWNRGLRARVIG